MFIVSWTFKTMSNIITAPVNLLTTLYKYTHPPSSIRFWVCSCSTLFTDILNLTDEPQSMNCRLTVVFLAFDVFFIIFCIVMACSFFLAIFCLIPIIAIAYAVATRKGACEDDIRSLPKYRYRLASPLRTMNNGEKQDAFGTGLESGSSNSSNELALYPEDSVSISITHLLSVWSDLSTCWYNLNHHFYFAIAY